MARQHQGKDVSNERAARQGDPGWDASKDQVVVTMPDGSEKTVPRSEVTGTA